MKPLLSILLVIGIAVGAWFLVDNWTSSTPEDVDGPEVGGGTDAGTDETPTDPKSTGLSSGSADTSLVLPEDAVLQTPAAVLLLGHNNDQWTATLLQAFGGMKDLKYASWFNQLTPNGGADAAGPGAGAFRGLPGLDARPTAEYLETHDIRALFLDSVDPNALGTPFWDAVARRVRSGRMGLYVRPNFPKGMTRDQPAPAVHSVLTHPVLSALLPVQEAKELRGTPPPGVYGSAAQGLEVTDAGTSHPATRLVPDRRSSQNAWNLATTGEGAIATKFVYPVEVPRTGRQVLVDMENGDYPAVIVGAGENERVLWMGNGDFGFETHFANDKRKFQAILITHLVVWLVGQSE